MGTLPSIRIFWTVALINLACNSTGVLHPDGTDSNPIPDPTSGHHWTHIKVWDFGRNIQYIPDENLRNQAYDFFASKVDVAEGQTEALLVRNPNMQTFNYNVDMTYCRHDSCRADYPEASDPQGAKEEFYLHFSQDTVLQLNRPDGSSIEVSIPGCLAPEPVAKECRMQAWLWTDSRYVFNPKNQEFRTWMAEALDFLSTGKHGVFLDEHGPGIVNSIHWGHNTKALSGGQVREYNNQTPDQFDAEFNTDQANALKVYRDKLSPKFLVINMNEWIKSHQQSLAMEQVLASDGTVTEFAHRPFAFDGGADYEKLIQAVNQIADAGGLVDLMGSWAGGAPEGYGAGNYASKDIRYQMWRLASYYMMRESQGAKGAIYFDPTFRIDHFSTNPLSFKDQWLKAFEYDVGQPDAKHDPYFMTGTATHCGGVNYTIMSRSYNQGKVLVLVRPRDRHDCNITTDESGVVVQLATPMKLLKGDGTLGAAQGELTLRNAEAVIMVK